MRLSDVDTWRFSGLKYKTICNARGSRWERRESSDINTRLCQEVKSNWYASLNYPNFCFSTMTLYIQCMLTKLQLPHSRVTSLISQAKDCRKHRQ